jgi:hypothetical protein
MESHRYRKTVAAILASVAAGVIIGVAFYWARQSFGWQYYWGSETHELRVLNALQIGLVGGLALFVFLFRRLRRSNSPPSKEGTLPNS